MDCCSIANTCVVSFVTSLAAILGVIGLYVKTHLKNENKQVDFKKD